MIVIIAGVFMSAIAFAAAMLGYGISAALRLDWTGRTAVADAVIAIVLSLLGVVGLAWLSPDPSDGVMWEVGLGLLGVVLRHVGRATVRRKPIGPAA
jgi:hypothetical protein